MANYTSSRAGFAHDGDEDRLVTLENKVVPIDGTIWNGQALQDGNGNTITSTYVKKSGDNLTGTLSWSGNYNSIQLRTGLDGYDGVITYRTGGNEAMCLTTKAAVTSIILCNGEDSITNTASDRWYSLTGAGLQVKNNCVSIGSLWGHGVTPECKLKVNGAIIAKHGHDFIVAGNEFNAIPNSFNSSFYINYDTQDRQNNGTVADYRMCNGKHGLCPVVASAHNTSSSRTIKENIEPLTNEEAQKILQIEPVTFNYIEGICNDTNPQIGVIAEDVEEILPMVVSSPPEEIIEQEMDDEKRQLLIKSVDYSKFTPYLIKMIQLQQEEINTLKQKVEQLEQVINSG